MRPFINKHAFELIFSFFLHIVSAIVLPRMSSAVSDVFFEPAVHKT